MVLIEHMAAEQAVELAMKSAVELMMALTCDPIQMDEYS